MSIDARIASVARQPDGSGSLHLIDRSPTRSGDSPGIAGQATLTFAASPECVAALEGLDVWGPSSCLMLGGVEIAKRIGYTTIEFHDVDTLRQALRQQGKRFAR